MASTVDSEHKMKQENIPFKTMFKYTAVALLGAAVAAGAVLLGVYVSSLMVLGPVALFGAALCTGLYVWCQGAQERIKNLSTDKTTASNTIFMLEDELTTTKKTLNENSKKLNQHQKEGKELKQEINKRIELLTPYREEINRLNEQLIQEREASNRLITQWVDNYAASRRECAASKREIEEKNAEIDALRQEIACMKLDPKPEANVTSVPEGHAVPTFRMPEGSLIFTAGRSLSQDEIATQTSEEHTASAHNPAV